jgi:hypothetical protein
MTEPGQATSQPTGRPRPRRRALYRRVLSLGAAAIVAAFLPFSMMYLSAVTRPAMPLVVVGAPNSHAGVTRVVTTASGATRVVPASAPTSSAVVAAPTPVSTHAS